MLWREVQNFSQAGHIQSSGRKMIVANSFEFSLPTRSCQASARYISILRPEVSNWYLVYQWRPSRNHVSHGLVMGDHMRFSKSFNRKDQNFSKAGDVLNSIGSSWSLVLWSIKRSTIYSQTAKSGYGWLRETVYILCLVNWGFHVRILITIFSPGS